MARSVIFGIFAVWAVLSPVLAAGQIADPPAESPLYGGLGPYLQTFKYGLFNKVVQKLNESTDYKYSTVGWFEGPTNQTLLVVADDNLRKGFAQLAGHYQISDPDTFIDRLIDSADGSTEAEAADEGPTSKAQWAAIALLAFASSHTLPEPYHFYDNRTILGTPYESPVNLTTSFIGEDTEIGSIQAYTAAGAQGPTTIYLRQDGGLLHAEDGLAVPLRFDVGYGINGASDDLFKELLLQDLKGLESSGFATPFLYELDGIFVYGQSFGSSDLDGYNADAALKYFAQHGI